MVEVGFMFFSVFGCGDEGFKSGIWRWRERCGGGGDGRDRFSVFLVAVRSAEGGLRILGGEA